MVTHDPSLSSRPLRQRSVSAGAVLVARLLLGAVFVLAAGGKLAAPAEFATVVERYQLLPLPAVLPVAMALPWLELLLGLYLLVGLFTRISATVAVALLAVFAAALTAALLRGLPLEGCGCFGSVVLQEMPVIGWLLGGADAGPRDLIRNGVLALLAVSVIFGPPTPWAVDRLLFRRSSP